ncbi:MAG TPA: ATP-binding protein [Gaiellaceae bacterium]|jgi:PAS domain S-box-containing protein|nr:ATP-binding protein [Gaiellaceae bacterium]
MTTEQASILLVDDRRENLLALEAVLEPLGHRLVSVTSGTEALKEVLLGEFACILLDVQMPELDGFEVATLIKQRSRSEHIPIIFVTALSKEDRHVYRGYSTGAVDYIFKPIDPGVLQSKVSVFVDLWLKTKQLQEQAALLHGQELADLERASEARYRQLADAMPQIVWTAGMDGETTYFNRRWFDYTGMTTAEAGPNAWHLVVHPDDLPAVVGRREATLRSGETFEVEYRFRAFDGTYRWHLGRAVPIRDEAGRIEFWVGTATDIHDLKTIEEQRNFIVAASDALSQSLNYRETLARVAELAAGTVADWCAVHIVEGDGTLSEVAVAHTDPAKVTFARELQERYPPRPEQPTGVAAVIRSGEPELVSEITEELLVEIAVDELHLDLLRELGLSSYMCVPLRSRDRVLGAVTLIASESGRRFREDDLLLAEELARRATTAIENAQLYRTAEERAEAARVLATIGDGVFLVDRAGRIRLWNAAAQRITGVAESDVLGRPAADAIPGWPAVEPSVPVAHTGEAVETKSIPVELGERELWLSFSAVGYEDGTVYAFRDLTEERALETMRQDLVATVSHELRTPLAAIYGAALTLRRADIELEAELSDKLLDIVAEESGRLSEIVDDLLVASQLDSGKLRVHIEHCDPREIAQAEIDAARTHLPANVKLALEAPRALPPVAVDAGQLRQVLANLIDNAIKYSPGGGRVTVALAERDHHVRFAVTDSGLGIPSGSERRIFEKFFRLDPHMERGIGGTGLGLYICRELVRRVNGRIWVEPTPGGGSTFFVEVPQEQPAHTGNGSRRAATHA